MTEIKPADADRFVAHRPDDVAVVLVYGPDAGLVGERVQRLIAGAIGTEPDPFALVELDADTVAADPGRLADEARAIGLFGGQRAVRLKLSGNRSVVPAIESLLDQPPRDCLVVIEGGEQRKGAPLRRLCERAPAAAALPCYGDDARALDRLIDEEVKDAGLDLSDDARTALRTLLGRDRMASRSELRKLVIYADGKSSIELSDIEAVVGDAASFALDALVDAVAGGEPAAFLHSWRRLLAEGTPGSAIATLALRHFQALHRARALVDAGTPRRTVIDRWVPPLFFQRRAKVEQQIGLWSEPRLRRALDRIDRAVAESRLGAIADEILAEALLAVALGARRR